MFFDTQREKETKRNGEGAAKVERKQVEKIRRMNMKRLCLKLSSLIPRESHSNSQEAVTQPDHLDQAASYIKKLKERIDTLKKKKMAMNMEGMKVEGNGMALDLGLPIIEVRHLESVLEVVLITGLSKQFMFHEVIGVLEEEGAEVVNASFSVVGDKIFYTIHTQAMKPRIGVEASRVSERLRELIRIPSHS